MSGVDLLSGTPTAARRPAIDWLKSFSILAVILTHAGLAAFPGTPGYTAWDTIFRHLLPAFHVPCLLMISGFLYYRAQPVGWHNVAQRLNRILLPYLVASIVVFALVPSQSLTTSTMVLALLGANALPIYYYVFLLVVFVVMTPVFSRLSRRSLEALVAGTFVSLLAMCVLPQLRLSADFFWAMRNPIESFTLGYFLLGWLAAARPPKAVPGGENFELALILAAVPAWPLCIALGSPYPAILVAKIPYALLVWKLCWRFLDSRPAPAFIRAVSDSTYGIFLYHFIAMDALQFRAAAWPPAVRIAALSATGVLGGLFFGIAVRRILGRRAARQLFGY